MEIVEPQVHIVAQTYPDDDAIVNYLISRDAGAYSQRHAFSDPEDLIEFAGRMCYRSWQPGLNRNVSKVRTDQEAYIRNILEQLHGSVLEHVTWTFVFQDVSRVLTHELARHRVGTATSQESMRYVRLADDIPVWLPGWASGDPLFMERLREFMTEAERFQEWMTDHFDVDRQGQTFAYKKKVTGFMRRFAPSGHATDLTWTANVRTLRHVIETRTAPGAEEEIRLVFGMVADIMTRRHPLLFGDFTDHDGAWVPQWRKV